MPQQPVKIVYFPFGVVPPRELSFPVPIKHLGKYGYGSINSEAEVGDTKMNPQDAEISLESAGAIVMTISKGLVGNHRQTLASVGGIGWPPQVDPTTLEQFVNQPGNKLKPLPEPHCAKNFYDLLYQCCLRSLLESYPVESLTCDTARDIAHLPSPSSCLDVLVNMVSDATPSRLPYDSASQLSTPLLRLLGLQSSNEDILLAEFLGDIYYDIVMDDAVDFTGDSEDPHCSVHFLCKLRRFLGTITPEAMLYKALFLDFFHRRWYMNCDNLRSGAVSSPMPWSRMSIEELSTDTITSERASILQICTPDDKDLSDDDHPDVIRLRPFVGTPIDIPWLDAPHDGFSFCPTLSSYTQTRLCGAIHSARDDVALWVAALTFGLLEAVTQLRIPESLLLVPGKREGERVISGSRLFRLLVTWVGSVLPALPEFQPEPDPKSQDAWQERGKQVATILRRAMKALNESLSTNSVTMFFAGYTGREHIDIPVAIMFLVVSMAYTARLLWDDLPEIQFLVGSSGDPHFPQCFSFMATYCAERMRRAGWCPCSIPTLHFTVLSYRYLFDLIHLPPFIRSTADEHKDCTESACVLYTLDTNTYAPQHIYPACSCEHIKPPVENIVQLLSEGVVPVVVYDEALRQLRVQPSIVAPYVSISHVWADGMGSTAEEGLPKCVVERIAGLVASVQVPVDNSSAFWMDSLCIPASGNLQKRAIKLMASTYRDAAKVLVFDASIRETCSRSKIWLENLIRIAASGWNRRVWTLQEGLLARELWFEFADGPININKERPTLDNSDVNLAISTVLSSFKSEVPNIPQPASLEALVKKYLILDVFRQDNIVPILDFRAKNRRVSDSNKENAAQSLRTLMGLLKNRTTTKPEDEVLAVSTLLSSHIDLDVLLSIVGPDLLQKRMKSLLIQLRELSADLPIALSMPRLSLPNFSWAPRALVQSGSHLFSSGTSPRGTGTCTEQGFLAEYYVVLFPKPLDPIPGEAAPFYIQNGTKCWDSRFVPVDGTELAPQEGSIEGLLFVDVLKDSWDVDACIAVTSGTIVSGADSVSALGSYTTTAQAPLRLKFICTFGLLDTTVTPTKKHCVELGGANKAWVLLQ
ncbi:hypothetical protein C8Q79DRAFT_1004523 [Trametes meyenii]|nr:hypothetical protein C8Q79DRAFT_1004523 [Trametes meyenii]